MGEQTVELAPREGNVSVDVSFEQIYERLGEDYVADPNEDEDSLIFLSALALECHSDDEYDFVDTLLEYFESGTHVSVEEHELQVIEDLLRE